jgi:predicted nucleic acid-binding protein
LDTNVLVYNLSAQDVGKRRKAGLLLEQGGIISVQVLNKFVRSAHHTLAYPLREVRDMLETVRELCDVQALDVATHDAALAIMERFRFGIYDATIVASALRAGATTLYTEDLQDGQRIGSLTIRNPFR